MTSETSPPQKSRHGCLTAYLLFLIVTNALAAILLLIGLSKANNPDGHPIGWKLIYIGLTSLSLVAALGLWRWRRWGFWLYGFCALLILALEVMAGADRVHILGSVAVLAVLCGVLQIGGGRRGWTQLE